jgi:hypothetical protein
MRKGAERLVAEGLEGINSGLMDRVARAVCDLNPDHVWTARMVADELVAAVKLCNRIGGRVLPADPRAGWPAVLRTWDDLVAQVETDEVGKKKEPTRYTPTARDVSRMERAVGWIGAYLSGPEHEAQRRVLCLWLKCKSIRGRAFSDALKRKRWSKATAYRVRDRALLTIAVQLMEKGIVP